MPQQPAWTSTPQGDSQRFELEPPGFVAFYRVALWALISCGAIAAPLILLAIFAALVFEFRDSEIALRILIGVAGFGGAGLGIWLTTRVLLGAISVRSRVTVTPAGVLVETGVTSARQRLWLAPLERVSAHEPKLDTLERGGLVLTAGDTSMHIAVGYRKPDRDRLLTAIQSSLERTPRQDGQAPAGMPLGPPWSARARRLAHDLTTPLRHPTPYLLVDVSAIVGSAVLTWILDEFIDWRDAYPVAFALFIVGLAARRYDGTYLAGLRHYLRENDAWSLRYMLAATGIALVGAGGMTPRLGFAVASAVATVTSIGLHWAMLRRARGEAKPTPSRRLDLLLALSLVPISILHEVAMFEFVVDSTGDLAAFSLTFVPLVVLIAYVPVRLHAFVDDPGDRSNLAWFWLTAIWLGSVPIIATLSALVREI